MRIDGWPMCRKCRAPVKKLQTEMTPEGDMRIVARCYGASEETLVTKVVLLTASAVELTEAFVTEDGRVTVTGALPA